MSNELTIEERPNKKNIESLDLPQKVHFFKNLMWKRISNLIIF